MFGFSIVAGIGIIVLQVAIVALAIMSAIPRIKKRRWAQVIALNDQLIAFVVILFAVTGSLIYSQVFALAPCDLCWWQRIDGPL